MRTLIPFALLLLSLPACKKEEKVEPVPQPAPQPMPTVEFRIQCTSDYWLDAWVSNHVSFGPIHMTNDTIFFLQGLSGNGIGFIITPTTGASSGRLYLNGALFGSSTGGFGSANPYTTTIP
jgi:hypothetical protein